MRSILLLEAAAVAALSPSDAFNCCTGLLAPDWTRFHHLELGGCINTAEDGEDFTCIEGGFSRSEAEFFTVYGRLKEGGCEAITDCPTFNDGTEIGKYLSVLSGLTLEIMC